MSVELTILLIILIFVFGFHVGWWFSLKHIAKLICDIFLQESRDEKTYRFM